MLRRLEDKIRELCNRGVTAGEDEMSIISDLRAALREHVERVRNFVAFTDFAGAKNRLRLERRAKQQESGEIRLVPPQDAEKKRKTLPVFGHKTRASTFEQIVELAHQFIEGD
jgi:hypothetical protein